MADESLASREQHSGKRSILGSANIETSKMPKVADEQGDLPIIPAGLHLLIPASVARTFGVIPVDQEDQKAVLVSKHPLDANTVDEIHFCCGPLEFRVANQNEFRVYRRRFDELLEIYYPRMPERLSTRCCPPKRNGNER